MRTTTRFIWLGALIALVACGCERKTTNEITQVVSPGASFYVGSDACQSCHEEIYADFVKTGHPYKLNDADDVEDADPGEYYPFTKVENPPTLPWDQIDLVIGGYWWKARYIRDDGKIYTGPDKQYNLRLDDRLLTGFVKYETDQDGVKDYDCGRCHTTGYSSDGNQDGKPGLIGTWAFNGIQCEECHGRGGAHANNPEGVRMTIDRSNALCGKCHIRGPANEIPAKGGFIRHHEQWNEMFRTKHSSLQCVTCHDPHIGLNPLNPDRHMAIRIRCENCHFKEAASFEASGLPHFTEGVDCTDCHMPLAAKSAAAIGTYEGDIHSHLWRINTDPDAAMFTPDGTKANGYLTLEFSCKKCHPTETVQDLSGNAPFVH